MTVLLSFLRTKPGLVVTAVLVGQLGLYYLMPTKEHQPDSKPLNLFSRELGPWRMTHEFPMEAEVADLLKASDTVSRQYVDDRGKPLTLFVAFFRSQRAGVSPHSPLVCLPGAGYVFQQKTRLPIEIAGRPEPIEVNRITISRGENKSVVLYWYQTPHRVIASEYMAKVHLVADSLRYRRSDTSIVRVIVPVVDGQVADAEQTAIRFVQTIYSPLHQHLPG